MEQRSVDRSGQRCVATDHRVPFQRQTTVFGAQGAAHVKRLPSANVDIGGCASAISTCSADGLRSWIAHKLRFLANNQRAAQDSGCPAVAGSSATMPSAHATMLRTNSGSSCRWLRMTPSLGTKLRFSTLEHDLVRLRSLDDRAKGVRGIRVGGREPLSIVRSGAEPQFASK
jgi:hypothetical protein